MGKLSLKVIIAIVITLGILKVLNLGLKDKTIQLNRIKDYHNIYQNNDSIDILFLGNSHAYNSFFTLIFDRKFKTKSFVLGSAAQKLETSLYLLKKEVLNKKTKPQLLVLETNHMHVEEYKNENQKIGQYQIYDNSRFNFDKVRNLNNIFGTQNLLYSMYPTFRNHNNWHSTNFLDFNFNFDNTNNYYRNGFVGFSRVITNSELKKVNTEEYNFKKDEIIVTKSRDFLLTQKGKDIFKEFISLCEQNNIELLIVTTPYFGFFNKNTEKVRMFFEKHKVNYLNISRHTNEIKISSKDFANTGHLNFKGAKKISNFLSNYIDKKYRLKPRENLGEFNQYIRSYSETLLKEKNFNTLDYYLNTKFKLNKNSTLNYFGIRKEEKNQIVFFYNIEYLNFKRERFKIKVSFFKKDRFNLSKTAKQNEKFEEEWIINGIGSRDNNEIIISKRLYVDLNTIKSIEFFPVGNNIKYKIEQPF